MKTETVVLTHNELAPCATLPDSRIYNNVAPGHPWKRVAQGHLDCLRFVLPGHGALILENDVRLRKDFITCLALAEQAKPAGIPYIVSFYVVSAPKTYLYIKDAPARLPDGFHDFGLQAIYYSPSAVPVAAALFGAYVSCPMSPDPQAFTTAPRANEPSRDGVNIPVDFWLYPTLRTLGVDVLHMAACQHMPHASGAGSPSHESMMITPEDLL
jgi:hypothetical protein